MPVRRRLSPARSALAALAVATLSVALATPASAAKPSGPKHTRAEVYVAMGDSYASGNGTGNPDLDYSCYRSSDAYAPIVTGERANTSLTFVACSGATTADIIGGQDRALSRKTALVTLSVGGNDIGFSTLIQACALGLGSCSAAVASSNDKIANDLPAALTATYADIRARAPKADVVVVGYPRAFDVDNVSCSAANGIDSSEATALNQVVDNLDSAISTAVGEAGSGFRYLDVASHFDGHDVCATDPYLHGTETLFTDYRSIYHPTLDGHRYGFAPLVLAALG